MQPLLELSKVQESEWASSANAITDDDLVGAVNSMQYLVKPLVLFT